MVDGVASNPSFPQDPRLRGFGLGARPEHYPDLLALAESGAGGCDWLELLSENYLVPGGRPREWLARLREHYPLVMHGVSLSVGSVDPLDRDYLRDLKRLADDIDAPWFSDHLCWTGVHGINSHDLLPLPYTDEAVGHVAARIREIQSFMERPFAIENVSSYLEYRHSHLTEWEFLAAIAEEADCGILLDVNNIYVSARNHGFEPADYLAAVPLDRVVQIHLAGHTDNGSHVIDTHDHPVCDAVWTLYAETLSRLGPVPTMIERDDRIPPFAALLAELEHARDVAASAVAARPVP